jgi:glutamine synthetase
MESARESIPYAKAGGQEGSAAFPSLPRSLEEALDALRRDQEFLSVGGVFPPELLELWLAQKEKEAAEVAARPHPFEFRLYA